MLSPEEKRALAKEEELTLDRMSLRERQAYLRNQNKAAGQSDSDEEGSEGEAGSGKSPKDEPKDETASGGPEGEEEAEEASGGSEELSQSSQ